MALMETATATACRAGMVPDAGETVSQFVEAVAVNARETALLLVTT